MVKLAADAASRSLPDKATLLGQEESNTWNEGRISTEHTEEGIERRHVVAPSLILNGILRAQWIFPSQTLLDTAGWRFSGV
jgi:hypothetical protein